MDTGELGTRGQDSIESPNPHSTAGSNPSVAPPEVQSHKLPNLFGLCIFRYKMGADGTFLMGAGEWREGYLCRPWHTVGTQ